MNVERFWGLEGATSRRCRYHTAKRRLNGILQKKRTDHTEYSESMAIYYSYLVEPATRGMLLAVIIIILVIIQTLNQPTNTVLTIGLFLPKHGPSAKRVLPLHGS